MLFETRGICHHQRLSGCGAVLSDLLHQIRAIPKLERLKPMFARAVLVLTYGDRVIREVSETEETLASVVEEYFTRLGRRAACAVAVHRPFVSMNCQATSGPSESIKR